MPDLELHRRIYIAVGHHSDKGPVERLIDAAGFERVHLRPGPGEDLIESSRRAIESADAVIGLVTNVTVPTAVVLELGMALALGRPVLLAVPAGKRRERVPLALQSLRTIAVPDRPNPMAVERLRLLLLADDSEFERDREFVPNRESGFGSDSSQRFTAFESDITNELQRLGGSATLAPQSGGDGGFDLAVSLEAIPPGLNPILVEAKATQASRHDRNQIRSALRMHGLVFGILVTADDRPPRWTVEPSTGVLEIGLITLQELETDEFQDLLTSGLVAVERS